MATETVNVDIGKVLGLRALQPVTNAEDWILVVNVFEDDEACDLDGETASLVLKNRWGEEMLTASGVLSDDADAVTSIVTFTVRASSLAGLPAGSYTVAARLTEAPATRQLLLAKLPILDGGFA